MLMIDIAQFRMEKINFLSFIFSTKIGLNLGKYFLNFNLSLFFTLSNAFFGDFSKESRQLFELYQIGYKIFENFLLRPLRPKIFVLLKI